MSRLLLVVCFAVAATSCIRVTAIPAAGAPTVAPRDPRCSIDFWPGSDRPERAYDILAEVRVSQPVGLEATPTLVRDNMRDRACAVGADAIIQLHETRGEGQVVLVGTAIRFRS